MTTSPVRVGIVGAGWAGAACARTLHDAGVHVEIFEAADAVGGHSRAAVLNGVVYEPQGPHVFHTNDPEIAAFVGRFGMRRPYRLEVLTRVHLDDDPEGTLLSWPPQLGELRQLTLWPTIERELEARPAAPTRENFEDYVIDLMGPTLYRIFVHGYTTKQWGCDPRSLSTSFAPQRIDLRDDGDRRLFRDNYEFFEPHGFNQIIENVANGTVIHAGSHVTLVDLIDQRAEFDAWVLTAALDEFVDRPGLLGWRGVVTRARYEPLERADTTLTPGYIVNHPDLRYPFTRTVETKHASGQRVLGTVVCEEHPGAPHPHYPVSNVDREYERCNETLKQEIRHAVPVPVEFCGRLANYCYINQDVAVRQGIDCARRILRITN